jgi:hypothetical protein
MPTSLCGDDEALLPLGLSPPVCLPPSLPPTLVLVQGITWPQATVVPSRCYWPPTTRTKRGPLHFHDISFPSHSTRFSCRLPFGTRARHEPG